MTTLVIKLTDNSFQTGLVVPGKRTIETIKAFPLYVAYEPNHATYFGEAEKKQSSICLMQPKEILQEKLDQIQSLDYILPVEINRNALNQFEIEVLHKNGLTVKAKKIYEVR